MGGVDRDDRRAIRSPLEIVIPITQAMLDDLSTEDALTGKMTLYRPQRRAMPG
jgi:hypothetical protein